MLTLDINYKTVTAFLLVAIVKGGKFDLGSTMRISALKQARLHWFILECFCAR